MITPLGGKPGGGGGKWCSCDDAGASGSLGLVKAVRMCCGGLWAGGGTELLLVEGTSGYKHTHRCEKQKPDKFSITGKFTGTSPESCELLPMLSYVLTTSASLLHAADKYRVSLSRL